MPISFVDVDSAPGTLDVPTDQQDPLNWVVLLAEWTGDAAATRNRRCDSFAVDLIRKHCGLVIKTLGHSVMAEFSDPAAAVRAAGEMQLMSARTSQTDQPNLRIGIHGRHCQRIESFGDVVNIAAKITQTAGSGQILASREVCDALSEEQTLNFQWFQKLPADGPVQGEDIFEVQSAATISGITPRYQAAFKVGSGGMGIVYKARDRETGDVVALKVLRAEIADDPAMQETLRREVCLARKVTHKNVCRIHEFNLSNNLGYISMEFIEGTSLLSILRRSGPLPWDEALKIAHQICAGLGEAHAQGIVHRDLKPANVMVGRDGVVKVMDFGIAHPFKGTVQMTGALVGTPEYMAPEQVELRGVDARTDIYSLGLLLYAMVTGSQAFQGDTPIAIAMKQLREFPKKPREIVPSLPEHAQDVILKCIHKDPRKRFQSMDELGSALNWEKAAAQAAPRAVQFHNDLRRYSRNLRADVQPSIQAVIRLIHRQDWKFLEAKRTQRALAVGLGVTCFLGASVAFTMKNNRKHGASAHSQIETTAGAAVRKSQVFAPSVAAADDNSVPEEFQSRPVNFTAAGQQVDLNASAGSPSSEQSSGDTESGTQAQVDIKTERNVANRRTDLTPKKATLTSAAKSAALHQAAAASLAPMLDAISNDHGVEVSPSNLADSRLSTIVPAAGDDATSVDDSTEASSLQTVRYFEVGSFKESAWADRAVEKLTQLGFHATSVRKNLLWVQSYQIRVGPYTDSKTWEAAKKGLIEEGFKPHPVK